MNKKLTFIIAYIILSGLNVNAQYFEWAKEASFITRGRWTNAFTVDRNGNGYLAGGKQTCQTCTELFVRKQDPNGNMLWEHSASTYNSYSTQSRQIAVDYAGNIYCMGSMDPVSISYIHYGNDTVYGPSFLFKLNSSGVGQWAIDGIHGMIAVDSAGNVYVNDSVTVRKFNTNKNLKWAAPSLPNSTIDVDWLGRCYILNSDSLVRLNSNGGISFGKNYGGDHIAVNKYGSFFILSSSDLRKYHRNGNLSWANTTVSGNGLITDHRNAYVIGNSLISKVSLDGANIAWSFNVTVPFIKIAADSGHNIYIAGNYDATQLNKLCPFKLGNVGGNTGGGQSYEAKINTHDPMPFQAGIYTGYFHSPWFCTSTPIYVSFSYCLNSQSSFAPNNEFRAQISNDNFTTFTDIGPALSAVIPPSVPEGNNYRFRVVSTNPPVTGFLNTSYYTDNSIHIFNKNLSITVSGNTTICSGDSVKLTATYHNTTNYSWLNNNVQQEAGMGMTEFYAKQTGTYTCRMWLASAGCDSTSSPVSITVNPQPSAAITPQGPTTFCNGDSVILAANTGTGLTYQWKKGGTGIPGATTSNYTATIGGVYKVTVTDSYECSKLSTGVTVSVPCRGENELTEINGSISIFPNPSSGKLTIQSNSEKISQIIITNISGQAILKKEIENNFNSAMEIDLTNQSKGIYLIQVITRKEVYNEKIILN